MLAQRVLGTGKGKGAECFMSFPEDANLSWRVCIFAPLCSLSLVGLWLV